MTPKLYTERCTCAMDGFTVPNDLHTSKCELWQNESFELGLLSWKAEMDSFVMNRDEVRTGDDVSDMSPWANADKWVWDGDVPVCMVDTAKERANVPQFNPAPAMCKQEAEAVDAMCNGQEVDEYGWVQLPCGSWADTEMRVTYRIDKDPEGRDIWTEEPWDADPINTIEAEVVECKCTPTKTYFCAICGVTRDDSEDPWRHLSYGKRFANTDMDSGWDGAWAQYGNTCIHDMNPIKFPKGTTTNVFASKVRSHLPSGDTPDLGLYMSESWRPNCPAIFIPWTDYGLPEVDYAKAARAIKTAFDAAKGGDRLEVGCIGSHGRTGTVLACMTMLDDPEMSAVGAIAWVRKVHCSKAVECASQEWFVAWFRHWMNGTLDSFTEPEPGNWKGGHTVSVIKNGVRTTTTYVPAGEKIGDKSGTWVKKADGSWVCEARLADEVEELFVMGTPPTDGNVAPGATANARRRATKREQRKERQLRNKQQNKRNRAYVQRGR